jgi:hypothetical protein
MIPASSAKHFCDRKSQIFFWQTAFESKPSARVQQRSISRQRLGMSSRFSLQNPYVVASLPQPIDRTNGRYVVGEVFGGLPGTKKRKRSELVVGIDGEGVNLYDVRVPWK